MSTDKRKDFILSTVANYFGILPSDSSIQSLYKVREINGFLDDGNILVLVSICQSEKNIQLYNELQSNSPDEQCIVFFKIKPEVVTADNIHNNVLVSSMFNSPISTLYHAIKKIFGPLILNSDVSNKSIDPKVQNLLSELESGLGSYLRKTGDLLDSKQKSGNENLISILTPADEIQYWTDQANNGNERAASFKEIFERSNFAKDFVNLDPLDLMETLEVVDISMDNFDELWKQDDHKEYPQQRMTHLFDIFGGSIGRHIQKKISTIELWKEKFSVVKENLQFGIQICEKWNNVCETLTERFWKTYHGHAWKGDKYVPINLMKLCSRLEEILRIRIIHEQHSKLLSSSERQFLNSEQAFQPFAGLNPVQYNPFTVPLWNAAVAQYSKSIEPIEDRIATKLREKFNNTKAKSFQLLREFQRYKELINRPNIKKALTAERETLLGQLQEHVKNLKADFHAKSTYAKGEGPPKGLNMSDMINHVVWARQLQAKVKELLKSAENLLGDTSSFEKFKKFCSAFIEEVTAYMKENYESWVKDTIESIDDTEQPLGLKTAGKLMELGHSDGKLEVQYDERLVKLIREVRQLQGMGYAVPAKIQNTATNAMKFYRQAVVLKQVAHFYNTIDQQMVDCQQAMMLDTALAFEKLVKNPKSGSKEKGGRTHVTWDNPQEVEIYIKKLQTVAEKLTTDNRRLRKCHTIMIDKAVQLMGIDLLRHQPKWKDILIEMRQLISNLNEQGFKHGNMKPWILHLDHQLYKALEHQYQLGLEALNENLPEIKVELAFRQQQLQFRPPFEEIRSKYYREIKKFITVPKNFKGLGENQLMFQNIIENNSQLFETVYAKAEVLFNRLATVKDQFRDWVVFGHMDMDKLTDEHLKVVGDWELNIKMVKVKGKEAEKLPLSVKVDCITVSTSPVKSTIDDLITKLFDTLLISLRRSIVQDYNSLDGYTSKSMDELNQVPQSIEEMGEVNEKYRKIIEEKVQFKEMYTRVEQKNKLLAQTAGGGVEKLAELSQKWEKLELMLEAHEMMVKGQMETMKKDLLSRVDGFTTELDRFSARWHQLKPANIDADSDTKTCNAAVANIKERRIEFNELVQRKEKLVFDCSNFDIGEQEFPLITELDQDITNYEEMWKLYEEFSADLETMSQQDWISFRSKTGQFDDMLVTWLDKLKKTEPNVMTLKIQKNVDTYKNVVPVLKFVRGETLSTDHWMELFRMVKMPKGTTLEKLIFGDILNASEEIIAHRDELKELNSRAQGFADKATIWETRLADLDEYLHNLNQAQRKWVYLEPIFGKGALPREQERFRRVDEDFRSIMFDVANDNRLVSLVSRPGIRNLLITLLDQLQRCQKSLNEFLEEKRSLFPRFYFIGDDDLLEILGQSTNPNVIQTHLKKLFAGIHHVEFDEGCKHILAMKSLEGEKVPLTNPVSITDEVEVWLAELASEMKGTLQKLLKECHAASKSGNVDPSLFPSQILCLAESILFTERCEDALRNGRLHMLKGELEAQLESYTTTDIGSSGDQDTHVLELKLKALILDTIHFIDVVDQLQHDNVRGTEEWAWQKQLRFYMDKKGNCYMNMVDAEFAYTYEYQGNASKLVHTPLTDKCYLTLTQGMKMGLGGNPYGPAGTGKTESIKALGGLFGRQVLVFNCDEGIDVKSMGRIFIGLVKCGAWGCFDEFNRLEEAVLSAVSMQIQTIQAAIKSKEPSIELLSRKIELDVNSGIFITLNPAGKGYGGRQKLPDNLKQLFRPVVMSKPNNELIAEVLLFSEGFKDGKNLGRKLVAIFTLASELLSQQQHYDWGLRALKTVLKGCGNILQSEKQKQKGEKRKVDIQTEIKLVVQALRLNTLSKLTFSDSKRFDALIKDVFPGISFQDVEYTTLKEALKEAMKEMGLVESAVQIKKALELYEQLRQRMGVVIVGPSGSGKSCLWRILRSAMAKIGQTVKQYTMNPKAMPRTQLLGQIDMDTREWSDGVLTNAARQVVREPLEVQSWIICDGDIDPEWIESLNSVLDDNRLLTMPSGERIQFGPNVNFLFETHDLSSASPATISRMGMIFLSNEDTDVQAIIKSWVDREASDNKLLTGWIDDYFMKALDFVIKQNDFVVETTLVGAVLSGLSHLKGVAVKAEFACALLRGLGANLNEESKLAYAKELFRWVGESLPDASRPLDTYYDKKKGRLMSYQLKVPDNLRVENFSSTKLPVILTPDVKRYLDFFSLWLKAEDARQPFILAGPEGCGKELLLNYTFEQLRSTQVATIHCNAQTSPLHVLQKLAQTCMTISTNTGRVYRPKDCERLILYLKDINLPKPDKWGTSQIVAFLQQVITYNGFYDFNLEWVGLDGVQIVASMNSSSSLGRHQLSSRFTSIVRICSIGYPNKTELETIYTEYLKALLQDSYKSHAIWGSERNLKQLSKSTIQIYEQVRGKFTVDDYPHYIFTPRDVTQWVLGLLRYDISDSTGDTAEGLLKIWAYQAKRLFSDRLVSKDSSDKFDSMLASVIRNDWSVTLEDIKNTYYVTWGTGGGISHTGNVAGSFGRPLGMLSRPDFKQIVAKGLAAFARDTKEIDYLIFREVLETVAKIDRVLTQPSGSLVLAGRSGVGRRTAVMLVAHMHQVNIVSPKISRGYGVKQFKNDLKIAMQSAGIDGEQVILLIEDHQLVEAEFLELINSLLCSGDVPGLYTSEELDPLLAPLRDQASQDGFRGPIHAYFARRVLCNLHIVLIMDSSSSNFVVNCEANPALYKCCSFQWLEGWNKSSMLKIPKMLLEQKNNIKDVNSKALYDFPINEKLCEHFYLIHQSCLKTGATPRQYLNFLQNYINVFTSKKDGIEKRRNHLQGGVSKLNEATSLVDDLKKKAAEQSKLLSEKQAEADAALKGITQSMQNAGDQKTEMERLKEKQGVEAEKLEKRKKVIEAELSEIGPLLEEAQKAVGGIKSESLSEIRALRMPPDAIRDILEGVLRLMGIMDTSWVSMRSFLAKRGVKEEICNFDAHNVSPEVRENVEELLKSKKSSFDPKVAKRASVAAAPLAAWVRANIQYSKVLEKIEPLEKEQADLQKGIDKSQQRLDKLGKALDTVDKKVADMKGKFEKRTQEAAKLKVDVDKAQETITAAETLVGKLQGEFKRWSVQVGELTKETEQLPARSQLAAGFITYLGCQPENVRRKFVNKWCQIVGIEEFDLKKYLTSESEQLVWKGEGLPSDVLSMENALIILKDSGCPFLVDPSQQATEWLKHHMKDQRLEVVNQQDANFVTSLELAVRFGKTLVIQEVDGVEPILYPILRKDFVSQGPRYVVQVGEKTVDYNESFRVFLTTRNPNPELTPDIASVINEANFTTTRAGLTGQLLALILQLEKPQLEVKKTELLHKEEELKIQLAELEESLLESLANAEGNILDNKELLDSLNKTKSSSSTITQSLQDAHQIQVTLDKERDAYLPLAEHGSAMYFAICDLAKVNNMYRFSLASFLELFRRALKSAKDAQGKERTSVLKNTVQTLVYEYISRCLFKADRQMFGLHLVHGIYPDMFEKQEWEYFCGMIVSAVLQRRESLLGMGKSLPDWVDEERLSALSSFKNTFSNLFNSLDLTNQSLWSGFGKSSQCEQEFPSSLTNKVSAFQRVLVVQALRPDRLQSAMNSFASKALGLKALAASSVNLKRLVKETTAKEPILILISPGSDPSQELQELADQTVGHDRYHQVAMGQGQAEIAMKLLSDCSKNGDWLCLKNLHLVTAWLPKLEKVLNSLQPNEGFRLWLTTETHPKFPTILLQSSLKVTFEAPPGIKKNMLRSYESWSPNFVQQNSSSRAQTLFALAWFHALVEERRNYIPQGWTKFYEFSMADLRAGADIIDRLYKAAGSKSIKWDFLHGLFENAIYGGRVDNNFDVRVLSAYLQQYFSDSLLSGARSKSKLFPDNIAIPASSNYKEFTDVVVNLPDEDKPSFFGLPSNIERSAQRIVSGQVISQLKILMRSDISAHKFDKEKWGSELAPILNLWKKLNQGSQTLQQKVHAPVDNENTQPVESFVRLEHYNAVLLVQHVHATLSSLAKVIKGTQLVTPTVQKMAVSLMHHETPQCWSKMWEAGPEDPVLWLKGAMQKTLALASWLEKTNSKTLLSDKLDLAELFHPDTFLNALRQQTARTTSTPMDQLKIVSTWKATSLSKNAVKIGGLQLEGCTFDGNNLAENERNSPSVSSVPPCTVAWIPKNQADPHSPDECIVLPVYCTITREKIVAQLSVPCGGDQQKWIKSGAALFLKNE
ncbi:cytoplasmic dynein 2 heavy chain 1-like isoform X2 [Hydractinia symbiolongicarpus]|uniref:cytoplasmic dynein 2 heavy chain 1-like isoform X2 n=1 Tax=Hydractinia symbiolongicarpus TaxID=13093 RepID=UPI00254C924B|nr:cytoplasmic dynein 2 heavy chain 1-like isoform X2 [Hydractinia symbiolongicarpus]